MDITFCTFYFDIDRKNWDSFTVPNDAYLNWFKNLLSLDIKLYITTQPQFVDTIRTYRKKVDPNFKKTIIQEVEVEDLSAYKMFNTKLENLMYSKKFQDIVYHKTVPEMTKPLYNVLMFNKVNYLQEVKEKNPFNTEYFSWVDAGFIRNEQDIVGITEWPDPEKLKLEKDKIKFFCIDEKIKPSVINVRDHLLSQVRHLKGTIFFLHIDLIDKLQSMFNKLVDDSISNGYIGSDEKIFDLCYLENPEMFDLFKCSWREELKLFSHNYEPPKETIHKVVCEWSADEIAKCDDFSYWFFCVEDIDSQSLFRDDFVLERDLEYFNFQKTSRDLTIISSKVPTNFVIWPVSKTKGFLTPVKKRVKLIKEESKDKMKINIDDYFFVNLDRRQDRLDFICKQIKKSNLLNEKIKKWTGIDGRNVNPDWIPSSILTKRAYDDITSGLPVVRGLSVTPGGLGFYLTHTKLFEYSAENNRVLFVMDDDINVNENFDQELHEILNELPETFDFCYLGYYDTPYEKIPYSSKLFKPRGQFCGPHGYIISPKGAKKLLSLIYPIDIQLDSKLYTIQNQVEYYAAYERLATYMDEYPTDIQHETGCIKNYEKTEVIKSIYN